MLVADIEKAINSEDAIILKRAAQFDKLLWELRHQIDLL